MEIPECADTPSSDDPSRNDHAACAAGQQYPTSSDEEEEEEEEQTPKMTKSQKIGNLQQIFTENQKIAYVGLCFLCVYSYKKNRLDKLKKALKSYDAWSRLFMEKLYAYIDVDLNGLDRSNLYNQEQLMINQLAEHGLEPADLSKSLIQEAKSAAEKLMAQQPGNEGLMLNPTNETDIRYTILSHLFILCVSDGTYDARERALIKRIAEYLLVPVGDIVVLENTISDQLRVTEELSVLRRSDAALIDRNSKDSTRKWVAMGLATLAGGAVIGLTAGLAAPLIGAGMTAALGALGVTGVTGALTGATGSAIIITSGALAGGGVSGKSMLKRTGGLTEFEFISYSDAAEMISEAKIKREIDRRRRLKLTRNEVRNKGQSEKERLEQEHAEFPIDSEPFEIPGPAKKTGCTSSESSRPKSIELTSVMWENDSAISEDDKSLEESRVRIIPISKIVQIRQTNVLITVSGWITHDSNDFALPFSTLEQNVYGDQYSLIWESSDLKKLGSALKILGTEVAVFLFQQGLAATVLPILMAGLTGPLWAIKLTYLMDNPWGIGLAKASRAGKVLAETLISQVQEHRPVTLVGFSLGARLIYYCLLELHNRGEYGLVEDVYLFGCPVMSSTKEWTQVASVVGGIITNGYLSKDWVLGVLYRASAASWKTVAGLGPIEGLDGFKNVSLDDVIGMLPIMLTKDGHLDYRLEMPKILDHCGFKVTQDYFDDEDELEERLLEELKEYRKAEEVVKCVRNAEVAAKREETRQKSLEEKAEQKRLGIRNTWLGTPEIKPKRLESSLPVLIVEREIEDEFMFNPKELTSTLPTLILPNTNNASSYVVRELETTLDALKIDDMDKTTGSHFEAQILKYALDHQNNDMQNASDSHDDTSGMGPFIYPADEDPEKKVETPFVPPEEFMQRAGALEIWDPNQWDEFSL